MKTFAWILLVGSIASFCASYHAQTMLLQAQAYQKVMRQPLPPLHLADEGSHVADAS